MKARSSVDPEWGAGVCLKQATAVKTCPLISFSPCPTPFFLWKSRTFFFIISVFSGLCGMLSLNAKMNAVVKESLSFCYSVFGLMHCTGVVAIWMWFLLQLFTHTHARACTQKYKIRYIRDEAGYMRSWFLQSHCCHYTVAFAASRYKTHYWEKSTIQRQKYLSACGCVCA